MHWNGLSEEAEMSPSLEDLMNGLNKQLTACNDISSVNPALEEENEFRLFLQASSMCKHVRFSDIC